MSLFRNLLIEKKRKPYYCEVEFIHSDGNQFIKTGFCPEEGKTMTFDGYIRWTASQGTANFFYGYRSVNSAEYRGDMKAFFIYGSTTNPPGRVAIRYGVDTENSTTQSIYLNQKYNISFDGTNFKVNGTTVVTHSQSYTPASNKEMWLFNCNTEGYYSADVSHFIGDVYRWQIGSGGVVACDFIPVLDWNMVPCFYNKVTGKLHYNQGTGQFTYGREIHYVEYLGSTSTQYIDTGIKLTNNHSVEIEYQLTQASQSRAGLFGALNMTGSNQGRFGSILSPSNSYLEHGYGAGNDYWQQGLPNTSRHKLYQKKNEVYFDGTLVHTFNSATFSLAVNAYLGNFVYTNYTPAKAKYYSSKWWDGDALVRDYYPAIDEDGIGFWFDKVTHTIFDNSGTGVFQYPAVQTEFLEVTDLGTTANQRPCLDLGLKYKSSMSIEGKFTRTAQGDSGSVLPLSNNTTPPLIYFPALDSTNKVDRFVWRRAGYSEKRKDKSFANYPVTTEFKFDAVNDILYIDGEVAMTGAIAGMGGYSSPYESSSTLYMLSIAGSYGGLGKVNYLKIYDTTQVYRDLIPAFKDGSFGMYDKEHNVLYMNYKGGNIVSGKIVESRWF